MPWAFPRCSVGYDTIEALLGTQKRPLALSSLLALLVVEKLLAHRAQQCHGFLSAVACSSLFLGAVLFWVICYGQWLGESGLHLGRCRNHRRYAMVAWQLCSAAVPGPPLTALLLPV